MEVTMPDLYAGVRVADSERARLIRSIFEPSTIEAVAEAVSAAWDAGSALYVERLEDRYRWSFAHKGGSYPLLRVTARFLQMDYQALYIGFRTVDDGYAVLAKDPEHEPIPDAAKILGPSLAPTSTEALQIIREAVG
jgi:hypothetical protein